MENFHSREGFDNAKTEEERKELISKANDEAVREDKDFGYSKRQREEIGKRMIQNEELDNKSGQKIDGNILSEDKNLEQDLTGLTLVETFNLVISPINPRSILEKKKKSSDGTLAGLFSEENFDNLVRPKIQDGVAREKSVSISSYKPDKKMTQEELKNKLGKAKLFSIDELATLIHNQSELDPEIDRHNPKISSPLGSNMLNLLLMEDVNGSVVLVSVYFFSNKHEWSVSVEYSWRPVETGDRILSHND